MAWRLNENRERIFNSPLKLTPVQSIQSKNRSSYADSDEYSYSDEASSYVSYDSKDVSCSSDETKTSDSLVYKRKRFDESETDCDTSETQSPAPLSAIPRRLLSTFKDSPASYSGDSSMERSNLHGVQSEYSASGGSDFEYSIGDINEISCISQQNALNCTKSNETPPEDDDEFKRRVLEKLGADSDSDDGCRDFTDSKDDSGLLDYESVNITFSASDLLKQWDDKAQRLSQNLDHRSECSGYGSSWTLTTDAGSNHVTFKDASELYSSSRYNEGMCNSNKFREVYTGMNEKTKRDKSLEDVDDVFHENLPVKRRKSHCRTYTDDSSYGNESTPSSNLPRNKPAYQSHRNHLCSNNTPEPSPRNSWHGDNRAVAKQDSKYQDDEVKIPSSNSWHGNLTLEAGSPGGGWRDDVGTGSQNSTGTASTSDSAEEEAINKKKRLRTRVMKEIFDSERSYQHHLSLVVQHFWTPMRRFGILPDHVLVSIFGNLQQLIDVNKELWEHLNTLSIGQAFLRLGPFLKLYSTYANGHERAMAVLMDWDQRSEEFATFRRQQEELPEMLGLKLNALLITPVQRIPRYKLLLEELLQYTDKDHADYENITDACRQVTEVAQHINDHIKQHDNFQKMLAIQRSLSGPHAPKIMIPGRIFIKEGMLKKVSKKGSSSHDRMFFLFSDMLLYTRPKLLEYGPPTYTCCCMLPLKHCTVQRVFGGSHSDGGLFMIQCKEESLLLMSDHNTVNAWVKALQTSVRQFAWNRQTLKKASSAMEPLKKNALMRFRQRQKKGDVLQQPFKKPDSTGSTDSKDTTLQKVKRKFLNSETNCFSPNKKRKEEVGKENDTETKSQIEPTEETERTSQSEEMTTEQSVPRKGSKDSWTRSVSSSSGTSVRSVSSDTDNRSSDKSLDSIGEAANAVVTASRLMKGASLQMPGTDTTVCQIM